MHVIFYNTHFVVKRKLHLGKNSYRHRTTLIFLLIMSPSGCINLEKFGPVVPEIPYWK